jgi:serine/threonine-protein kinase
MTLPSLSEPLRIDRYEVVRELGRGAMGTVFLARDSKLGRLVALKTFRLGGAGVDLEDSAVLRRRTLREAQRAGTLSHPNVVTIYDVVETGDAGSPFFIVMEFVEGRGLDMRLRERGPLPLDDTVIIAEQIASALDHLHARGIIHRDIKPANVLVGEDGRLRLTDFGIARGEDPTQTLETAIYGTPQYMAPEQVQGRAVDARTDVFALGVLLYEMLTGRRPFPGTTVAEVAHRIVYGLAEPPAEVEGRPLPAGVQEVLARALARDPADRFQTAGALAAALRAAAEAPPELDGATRALPRERWFALIGQEAAGSSASQLWRSLALAAIPAVLLLVAALLYLRWQGANDRPTPDLEARQASYQVLLAEGRRMLAAGDPAAAAVLFQTAEGMTAEGAVLAGRLRSEAVRQAAERGADLQLAGAREDLAAGRYQSAIDTAREMLGDGSGREEALQVLAEVQQALAATQRPVPRPRAAATTPSRPAALGPVALAPVETPPPQAAPAANPRRATLVVDLRSEVAETTLTVWAGERALVQEHLRFYSGSLLSRRPALPGTWNREIILSPGELPLRVLVAREGEPGEVRTLRAALTPGGRTVLAIAVPATGGAEVVLE